MFKVLIWDYMGISAQWTDNFLRKDTVEIVRTLRPDDKDQAEVILRGEWNFVLIFEQNTREIFDEMLNTMRAMNFSTENIIFANNLSSWLQNPAATLLLIKPSALSKTIHLHMNFEFSRQFNNFVTCTVEGLSYVATSQDYTIMRSMYTERVNWSSQDMKRFHALARKYYNVDDSAGYFLDLGANIGTTGIYFLKKLAPNLKLLAFEPDPENFKMHRLNVILNDMEDKSTIVNCGLGDKFGEMTMYRNVLNPGANSVVSFYETQPTETIKIIPLDSYLAEKNIAAQEVKYIWIDVEGLEAQVILGAKNLLTKNPAPIFVEFNLGAWRKSGHFAEFMSLIESCYSHFILFAEGKEILCPLNALRTMNVLTDNELGQIGDIFLIRKGAVVS